MSRYDEFQRFREDLNEKILARGTTNTKRFFTLDSKVYQGDTALSGKTKELLEQPQSSRSVYPQCVKQFVASDGVT